MATFTPCTDKQKWIADIANDIFPFVIAWNEKVHFRCSEGRGTQVWKQILKNNFVRLTQFTSQNPRQRKLWKEDLVTARDLTVEKICPNWQTKEKDSQIHGWIHQTVQKMLAKGKSPRADWLQEKAYAWLQSLSLKVQKAEGDVVQVGTEEFPSGLAIQIAHHSFQRGGKFPTFMKYLQKRTNPKVKQLIKAHEGL